MRGVPDAVLVGVEEAPQLGPHAQKREERSGDQLSGDALCLWSEPETEPPSAVRSDGGEAVRAVAEVQVTLVRTDRNGGDPRWRLCGRHVDSHDAIRIDYMRRRPEEQAVHYSEHRGVRPDAEP